MKTWLFAAAIAALIVQPALADEHEKSKRHGGKMHEMMEKADADGDGKINKEEFINAHAAKFEKMDADGDGFLTDEEMKSGWQAMHEKMRARKQHEHHEMHEGHHEGAPVEGPAE